MFRTVTYASSSSSSLRRKGRGVSPQPHKQTKQQKQRQGNRKNAPTGEKPGQNARGSRSSRSQATKGRQKRTGDGAQVPRGGNRSERNARSDQAKAKPSSTKSPQVRSTQSRSGQVESAPPRSRGVQPKPRRTAATRTHGQRGSREEDSRTSSAPRRPARTRPGSHGRTGGGPSRFEPSGSKRLARRENPATQPQTRGTRGTSSQSEFGARFDWSEEAILKEATSRRHGVRGRSQPAAVTTEKSLDARPKSKSYALAVFASFLEAYSAVDQLRAFAASFDQVNIVIEQEGDMADPKLCEVGVVYAGAAWALIHQRRLESGWYEESAVFSASSAEQESL